MLRGKFCGRLNKYLFKKNQLQGVLAVQPVWRISVRSAGVFGGCLVFKVCLEVSVHLLLDHTCGTLPCFRVDGVGSVTKSTPTAAPTVTIAANPTSVASGSSATLTVSASNASSVQIAGSDGTSYTLPSSGGTQAVSPTATTKYTATATGPGEALRRSPPSP